MKHTFSPDHDLNLFVPHSAERPAGLHLSDIYSAMAQEKYPDWFRKYPEGDARQKQIRHFEKGLILEEAWGEALGRMMSAFERPDPTQVDGVWMSPDGRVAHEAAWSDSLPPLVWPSIHECKVTLKSCRERDKRTGAYFSGGPGKYILHEKYCTWHWQMKGYCYGYGCRTAFLHVCHLLGDYGERPWTPQVRLHRFDYTEEELGENWRMLMTFAQERGLR